MFVCVCERGKYLAEFGQSDMDTSPEPSAQIGGAGEDVT